MLDKAGFPPFPPHGIKSDHFLIKNLILKKQDGRKELQTSS